MSKKSKKTSRNNDKKKKLKKERLKKKKRDLRKKLAESNASRNDNINDNHENVGNTTNDVAEFFKNLLKNQQVSQSELDDSLAKINLCRRKAKKYPDSYRTTALIEQVLNRCQLLAKQKRYREMCCWYFRCIDLAQPFVEAEDPTMQSNLGIIYALLAQVFIEAKVNRTRAVEYWKLSQIHLKNALDNPELPFEVRSSVQHSYFAGAVRLATLLYEKQKSTAAALAVLSNCDIKDFFHDSLPDNLIRKMAFEYSSLKQKCLLEVRDFEGVKKTGSEFLDYTQTLPVLHPQDMENIIKVGSVAMETAEKQMNWKEASAIALRTIELVMNAKDAKIEEESQSKSGKSKEKEDTFDPTHPENSPVLNSLKMRSVDNDYYDLYLSMAKNMIRSGSFDAAMLTLQVIEYMEVHLCAHAVDQKMTVQNGRAVKLDKKDGRRTYLIALCYFGQKQYEQALEQAFKARKDEIASCGGEWDSHSPNKTLGDIEKLIGDIYFIQEKYRDCIRFYLARVLQYRNSMGVCNPENTIEHAESLMDIGRAMLEWQQKGNDQANGEALVWFLSAVELIRTDRKKKLPDLRFTLAKACAGAYKYWLRKNGNQPLLRHLYSLPWLLRVSKLIHSLQKEDYDLSNWSNKLLPIDSLNVLIECHEKEIAGLGGRESIVVPKPRKFNPDTAGKVLREGKDSIHEYAKTVLSRAEYHSFLISQGEAEAGTEFPPQLECYPLELDDQIYQHMCDNVYRLSFSHFIHNVLTVQERIDKEIDFKEIMSLYLSYNTIDQRHAFHQYCTVNFLSPTHFENKNKIMKAFDFIRKLAKDPKVAEDYLKEFPDT